MSDKEDEENRKMFPAHIISVEPCVQKAADEATKRGYVCTFGDTPTPEAAYLILPKDPVEAITGEDIVHAMHHMKVTGAERYDNAAVIIRKREQEVPGLKMPPFVPLQEPVPPPLSRSQTAIPPEVKKKMEEISERRKSIRIRDIQSLPEAAISIIETEKAVPAEVLTPAPPPSKAGKPIILHVMPWDLTVGGGQRMLDDWCTNAGDGWETHIVTAGLSPGMFPFKGATISQIHTAKELEELCRKLKPDVVVNHNPDHYLNPGARAWPQVWYIHGEGVLAAPPPEGKPGAFITNYPQEAHKGWSKFRRHIVRLGVDTKRFCPVKKKAKEEKLVCGIIGRISVEKLPKSFIDAMRVWDPGPWEFRFIGVGIPNIHQAWVRDNTKDLPWVTYAGDVSPADMPAVYQDLDMVMIPSTTETGSYAMVEAMACGVPVICRNLPGPRFVSGNHAIFEDKDENLLSSLRNMDSSSRRKHLGDEGREWAVSNLDINYQMGRLSAAYAAVAHPRVSILMPVYNTPPEYLREAVNSVKAQTEKLWELVLVNDGSPDEDTKRELILLAMSDPRIRLHTVEHSGCAGTLNKGLRLCRCDLVARMDSDDVMFPTRIEKQLEYMIKNEDVDVLGTQMSWSNKHGVTGHAPVVDMEVMQTRDFVLNHPTVMYRHHCVEAAGGYDTTLPAVEDFDLWLRMVKSGYIVHNLQEPLLKYREHAGQMSRQCAVMDIVNKLREKNGVPKGGKILKPGRRPISVFDFTPPPPEEPSSVAEAFEDVYRYHRWGTRCLSGDGSAADQTEPILKAITAVLTRLKVKSVLDVGCGISEWIEAAIPKQVTRYVGCDVVPMVVLKRKMVSELEGAAFRIHDFTEAPFEETFDLAIARDVFVHLSEEHILAALKNIRKSTNLLLTTHFPCKVNDSIKTGQWRHINLNLPPFRFPTALAVIEEVVVGKTLRLYDLTKWTCPK